MPLNYPGGGAASSRAWSVADGSLHLSPTKTGWLRTRRVVMEIKRCGSQPSQKGPEDYFTGTVRVDPLFLENLSPSLSTTALVTFEPGARTAWHVHPLGQILIILSGCGRVQREGGPVEVIRGGDAVRFAPRRTSLARRLGNHGDVAYRHPGKARWQRRHLAGQSDRGTIQIVKGEVHAHQR